MSRVPCRSCPWRKGSISEDIPNFNPEGAQELSQTCRDDGFSVMACHKSTDTAFVVCAGFALQVGYESVGLRMLARSEDKDIVGGCSGEGTELHDTFEEMLEGLGLEPPPRNRFRGHE